MREMQSAEGGYFSSLDADSEHEEGKFYVWTRDEVKANLAQDEYAVAARHFGLGQPPNFENRLWHLRIDEPLVESAQALDRPMAECEQLVSTAKDKLRTVRERRVRPGRDDKILTSWNALMIEGMAHAAAVFGRDEWLDSARRALDFVRNTLWQEGRLLATWKDGRAHLNAYLDDYAYMLSALIEMLQADFRQGDLEWAEDLADVLLEQFEDRARGAFFFTSHDHEKLIHRAKIGHDNATPSGNGVALHALQRLSCLTGEARYRSAAERGLQLYYPQMLEHPSGYATLAVALEEALAPPTAVILRGPDAAARQWQSEMRRQYLPNTLILSIPLEIAGLPPILDKAPGDPVNAWVCSGVSCLPPITELAELERVLAARV